MNDFQWAAVLGMFVATYAVRASFIVFGQKPRFPPAVVQALGHAGGRADRDRGAGSDHARRPTLMSRRATPISSARSSQDLLPGKPATS